MYYVLYEGDCMSFKDEFIKILGDTSIYSLYKITGIERTKLQRIKNGQRLPSNEDIEKISRALSLTVFEKKRLYQALEIETIGEDKYKSRGCTKQFLEDLFYVFQNSTDSKINFISNNSITLKDETITVNGLLETQKLVNWIVKGEASIENDIFILTNDEDNPILNAIYYDLSNNPKIKLRHVFALKPHNECYNSYYSNIKFITTIYPIFLSQTDYTAYYYYSNPTDDFLFSSYIITNNISVSISYDFKSAVITKNKDVIAVHKRLCELKKKQSYPLIIKINLFEDYIDYYTKRIRELSKNENKLITLEYEPCILPFVSNELLQKYIHNDFLNNDEIYKKALSIFSLYGNYDIKISIFTENGLKSFLHTGKISEIPDYLYSPVSVKDRISILRSVCQFARNYGKIELHLIDEKKMHIPHNLRYCGTGQIDDFFILMSKEANNNSMFQLNECGFSKPFFDFVNSLIDTDLVLSNEQTVEFIENAIKEFEK